MDTIKNVYAQKAEREINESELLDLVATISRMDDQNASGFIIESVQTATAKALGFTPIEYELVRLTPAERIEVVRLVAKRDGLEVADFIREAVIAAAACSIGLDEQNLKDILGKSESWATMYC